jgi:hypothetical protein
VEEERRRRRRAVCNSVACVKIEGLPKQKKKKKQD